MKYELWKVKCKYFGNVFIASQLEKYENQKMLHPAMKNVRIKNELGKDGKPNGQFELEISYIIEIVESKKRDNEVIARDLGLDLLSVIINLISFYSNNRIIKIGDVLISHDIDDVNSKVIIDGNLETLKRMIKINSESLMLDGLDSKLSRVISFYVYGLNEKDKINSFIFYMSAIDMLSGILKVDGLEGNYRVCQKCKNREKLEPSTAKKVQFILMEYTKCSKEKAEQIWSERNSIAHGFFKLDTRTMRELDLSRVLVKSALMKGIKHIMKLNSNDLPDENDKEIFSEGHMILSLVKNKENK